MAKNAEKEFYGEVQRILTEKPDILQWLNETEPSISEFLLKLSDDLGGQKRVEDFIKHNVEPRMQTSFAGRASEVSARFILSRLVEAIDIEPVDLTAPVFTNDEETQQKVDECFKKIKKD
jgi:hypothetical protein